MIDIDEALARMLRAHAPALTSAAPGTRLYALADGLELRAELGLDPIALAELAIAAEEAFDIEIDGDELGACVTLGHFSRLVHAKVKAEGRASRLSPSVKPAG